MSSLSSAPHTPSKFLGCTPPPPGMTTGVKNLLTVFTALLGILNSLLVLTVGHAVSFFSFKNANAQCSPLGIKE